MMKKQKKTNNTYSVYIISIESEVVYIGLTKDFNRRSSEHRRNVLKPKNNHKLYNLLKENIDTYTIDEIKNGLSKKEAEMLECYFILKMYFENNIMYQSLPKSISYYK